MTNNTLSSQEPQYIFNYIFPAKENITIKLHFPRRSKEYLGPEQVYNISFNYISSAKENNILALNRAVFIPTDPIFLGYHGFIDW
jgi:hypothetical protein